MKRAVFFALLFCVAGASAHIRLFGEFDPESHELYGTQWVEFREARDEAWFVLLANVGREPNPYVSPLVLDSTYVFGFDPAWTRIEEVVWESTGESLPYELLPAPATIQTYSLEEVLLRVSLPGEPGTLRLSFRTRFPHVWVEPGRLENVYTWRFGWHPILLAEPPGEAFPYALPYHQYEVELVLPEGWQAFLPGEMSAGENKFHTKFSQPVNSVALFFGPKEGFRWVSVESGGRVWEGVALPGDEASLRTLLTWAPEILSWYEERFGPYPHGRILLVEHPTNLGVAMAAEGIVFLPRWFFSRENLSATDVLSRLGLYVLAHELAHLWWGIGVGVDFDAENWLSEGFSQYLSLSWYEEKFGAKGGNLFLFEKKGLGEEVADHLLGFLNLREHFTELPYLQMAFEGVDEAVVKPTREVRYDQVSAERLYDKGYLILRALAHVLGEDIFSQALRRVAREYRGKLFSVQEFQRLLSEESGQDLSHFFSDWVLGEAWADYGIAGFRQRGNELEVFLTYRGTGILPVPVALRGPEDQRKTIVWNPSGSSQEELSTQADFRVTEVIVDPDHRVLDVDRLNNRLPRRYVVTGKNDLPLDGYLVSLGSGGAFSLSYLDRFGFMVYPQGRSVAGFVSFGREGMISGRAEVQDTLVGEVTFGKNLWHTPPTGSTATYWENVGQVAFTLGRLPEWALSLGVTWREILTHVRASEASILVLPDQGFRISLAHTELFGLAPHLYPTLTLSLGFASAYLSPQFWPVLREFRGLVLSPEGPPAGRHKAVGVLGVWLPPHFPNYSLAQAALVSEVRPRLFLAAGQIWNELEPRPTYLEAGGELWITVEALGGFLRVDFVVGLAYPLIPGGPALLYFGFAR